MALERSAEPHERRCAVSFEIERIAYEHALRAADVQERALADLRTRAGTVLAAAALVASFVGTAAVHHPNSWGLAVAVACLLVLVVLMVYVLLGKKLHIGEDSNHDSRRESSVRRRRA